MEGTGQTSTGGPSERWGSVEGQRRKSRERSRHFNTNKETNERTNNGKRGVGTREGLLSTRTSDRGVPGLVLFRYTRTRRGERTVVVCREKRREVCIVRVRVETRDRSRRGRRTSREGGVRSGHDEYLKGTGETFFATGEGRTLGPREGPKREGVT